MQDATTSSDPPGLTLYKQGGEAWQLPSVSPACTQVEVGAACSQPSGQRRIWDSLYRHVYAAALLTGLLALRPRALQCGDLQLDRQDPDW